MEGPQKKKKKKRKITQHNLTRDAPTAIAFITARVAPDTQCHFSLDSIWTQFVPLSLRALMRTFRLSTSLYHVERYDFLSNPSVLQPQWRTDRTSYTATVSFNSAGRDQRWKICPCGSYLLRFHSTSPRLPS